MKAFTLIELLVAMALMSIIAFTTTSWASKLLFKDEVINKRTLALELDIAEKKLEANASGSGIKTVQINNSTRYSYID